VRFRRSIASLAHPQVSRLSIASPCRHVLVDTPGQIEIFTWSASGSIITDTIASALPTVVAYIIDTPRTTSPTTFMSNMLYACSILYKTKLPFLLVFNKTDVQDHLFAVDWMRDFEVFQDALMGAKKEEGDGEGSGYMTGLMNSMALVLDEFYQNLRVRHELLRLSARGTSGLTPLPLPFHRRRLASLP
jgi:GTPase SAR1 family protein